MIVDYEAAKVALDAVDWKITSQPEVTIHLSEPDEDGLTDLTISGSPHAEEMTIVTALRLQPGPPIRKHTPSAVGQVMSEPHRQPSAAAAQASIQPKGRITPERKVRRPKDGADFIEANVAAKPRQTSKRGK